jgi:hypothetical protein
MIDPTEVSAMVLGTFLGEFRPYLQAKLAERNLIVPDSVIDEAEQWLADHLADELGLDFAEQRRGPLEFFQAAMEIPTDWLLAAGTPQVERDLVTEEVLPGDAYDLAPASSRDLGEEAWMAHMSWGTAKAAAYRKKN